MGFLLLLGLAIDEQLSVVGFESGYWRLSTFPFKFLFEVLEVL